MKSLFILFTLFTHVAFADNVDCQKDVQEDFGSVLHLENEIEGIVRDTSLDNQSNSIVLTRGRVDYRSDYLPSHTSPMRLAEVKLCKKGSIEGCKEYTTGYGGMYYFEVKLGHYDLYVNNVLVQSHSFSREREYFDYPVVIVKL